MLFLYFILDPKRSRINNVDIFWKICFFSNDVLDYRSLSIVFSMSMVYPCCEPVNNILKQLQN